MHPIQAVRKAGTEGEERDTGDKETKSRLPGDGQHLVPKGSVKRNSRRAQNRTRRRREDPGPIKHPSQSPFSGLPSCREQALFFSVFSNGLR